jgi:hypothetical protein
LIQKTKRTWDIIEFIEKFRVADITHIVRMFYPVSKASMRNAQVKLSGLVEEGTLKRRRNDINCKYYYYIGKELAQVQHKLLITELYVSLCSKFAPKHVECIPEYTKLDGIRPDAFVAVLSGKRTYLYFVEAQISNNSCDLEKYERAFQYNKQIKVFPEGIFPTVLYITDQRVSLQSKNFNVITMGTNLNISRLGLIA